MPTPLPKPHPNAKPRFLLEPEDLEALGFPRVNYYVRPVSAKESAQRRALATKTSPAGPKPPAPGSNDAD